MIVLDSNVTKSQILTLFANNASELASDLGVTKGAVSLWKPDKPIPELRLIQFIVNGNPTLAKALNGEVRKLQRRIKKQA